MAALVSQDVCEINWQVGTPSMPPVKVVETVHFEIMTPEETEKQSVAEIHVYDVGKRCPKGTPGSLTDRRLGASGKRSDPDAACGTCEGYADDCPGHFGHIKLRIPNYHIGTLARVKQVLECVCANCGRLRLGDQLDPDQKTETARTSVFRQRMGDSRQQPSMEGTFNRRYWKAAKDKQSCWSISCGRTHQGIRLIGTCLFWTRKLETKMSPVELKAPEAFDILNRITQDSWHQLAPSATYSPTDLLLTVLPVPPPAIRPRIDNYGKTGTKSSYSDDVLTELLSNIIRSNHQIMDKRGDGEQILQTNIHLYLDARRVSAKMTGGRCSNTKGILSLAPRLAGKEGRMRQNIQGKRVDFSARTVVTGDPNIQVDEIGIPRSVAMGLSKKVCVTPHNYLFLTDLVHRGPTQYPGANMIHTSPGPSDIMEMPVGPGATAKYRSIDLKVRARSLNPPPALQLGDMVDRHLLDGDQIMVNRQPSLHKYGMMAHRVRVMTGMAVDTPDLSTDRPKFVTRWKGGGSTFRLNLTVTTPYNGDFDGDEFNIHVPQDEEASAECTHLANVQLHLVSPQSNKAVMGIVQDDLQGIYQFTGGIKCWLFDRAQTFRFMLVADIDDLELLGVPHITYGPGANSVRYSGQQIFSALLPPQLNYVHDGVTIRRGKLITGPLTKAHLGPGKHGGLLQQIWLQYGDKYVFKFIHQLQQLSTAFLLYAGFSVGIGDMVKPRDQQALDEINNILGTIPQPFETPLTPEILKAYQKLGPEGTAIKIGNANAAISSLIDQDCRRRRGATNIQHMTDSGSKGSRVNATQMSGCVGPQQLGGMPMQRVFGHTRTLPHFPQGHCSARSLGFVANSYLQGLDPAEFFFHAVAAREGLIDTACKTGDVGYISRRMIKATESITLAYDGTVRNAMNEIIQMRYGHDGFDGKYIEHQVVEPLRVATCGWLDDLPPPNFSWPPNEVAQLYQDDRWLEEKMGWKTKQKVLDCHQPVHLQRLLDQHAPVEDDFLENIGNEATPEWIQLVLAEMMGSLQMEQKHPLYTRLLRRCWNSAAFVSRNYTERAVNNLVAQFVQEWYRAKAEPGENVGVLASQSLAEILVQITLNTFHSTGTSSAVVTEGVPRLKENIDVVPNIKTPIMMVRLKPEFRRDRHLVETVAMAMTWIRLQDLVAQYAVYFQPLMDDGRMENQYYVEDDKSWLQLYYTLYKMELRGLPSNWNSWAVRLELDDHKLDQHQVSSRQVQQALQQTYPALHIVRSPETHHKSVLYLRIKNREKTDNDAEFIRYFVQEVVTYTTIKGIHGISKTFVLGYQHEDQTCYEIQTVGSNLSELATWRHVDMTSCTTNHPLSAHEYLGLDAALQTLQLELKKTILQGAGFINSRHYDIITLLQSNYGRLLSLTRFGLNQLTSLGAIGRSSFEQAEKVLMESSMNHSIDTLCGVSSRVALGQQMLGGTGSFDVILDQNVLLGEVGNKRKAE